MANCFRSILLLLPAALGFLFLNSPQVALAQNKPNIIWIVADDLGYNDLGCMGQQNFETPCIDQMAKEGMIFSQFYAGCTVCAPSRACFLTGQHTGHVYQRFNGSVQFREDPLDRTIAGVLKANGYHTAMIGKSGLSCNSDDGELPNRKGFDYFFGFTSHGAAHRYFPGELWRNGEKIKYPENHGKEGLQYSGDLFLAESLQWIEANQTSPFFLHMSLQQPHADLQVTQKWREKYLGKFEESANPDGHYRGEANPKATYAGMVSYLDDSVGQVLDLLKRLNIDERTIVMFTSDNGPHFEGGGDPANFDSNGPLRGGKRDFYEGGIRVPLIVRGPGIVPAGKSSDHIGAFWDFPATVCELAGIPCDMETDGVSLAATMTGQPEKQAEHEYLYWEFYEQGGKQAVRAGDWKGIRLDVGKNPGGQIELYNLKTDIGETNNVAGQHPEVVKKLRAHLDSAHIPSDIVSFGPRRRDQSKQQKK